MALSIPTTNNGVANNSLSIETLQYYEFTKRFISSYFPPERMSRQQLIKFFSEFTSMMQSIKDGSDTVMAEAAKISPF